MIKTAPMLVSLHIKNLALIENVTIEFGEGLNILSGETGAGKSILVQAIELLLGGRSSVDSIREGTEETEVSGLFHDGVEEISLRRVITRGGKNRAYLNERPVPVSVLSDSGREWIELSSQHEYQNLLQAEAHLEILDDFAGLSEAVSKYQEKLQGLKKLSQEKEALIAREKEARAQEDFLKFQLKELSQAKLQEGEEEKLQQERSLVKNAVKLGDVVTRSEAGLESGDDSVGERLSKIAREWQSLKEVDPRFEVWGERLEKSLCDIQETAHELRDYLKKISFDPERLDWIDDRLTLLSRLRKKYGGSLEGLKEKEENLRQSLDLLENFEMVLKDKDNEFAVLKQEVLVQAKQLSAARKKEAQKLSQQVEKELKSLGMSAASFRVSLAPLQEGLSIGDNQFLGERGLEGAEFMMAPNPGEGEKALVKIASGGELSRVFLALKKVLIGLKSAHLCVFDEVDAGIGGAIAEVVGQKLADLAEEKQVICITHLPQIACYGSHHFMIQKEVVKGRTLTRVLKLETQGREEEIARMLAGVTITDRTLAHAREMLQNASFRVS